MCELTPCHHCGVLAGAPASGRLGSREAGRGASRYGSAPSGVAVFLPASCPRPLPRGSFVYLPFMFSVSVFLRTQAPELAKSHRSVAPARHVPLSRSEGPGKWHLVPARGRYPIEE